MLKTAHETQASAMHGGEMNNGKLGPSKLQYRHIRSIQATHNHAENGYQQRLADRTKTRLSTKTRLVTAKARLEARRCVWLARLGPFANDLRPLAIMRAKIGSQQRLTDRTKTPLPTKVRILCAQTRLKSRHPSTTRKHYDLALDTKRDAQARRPSTQHKGT